MRKIGHLGMARVMRDGRGGVSPSVSITHVYNTSHKIFGYQDVQGAGTRGEPGV